MNMKKYILGVIILIVLFIVCFIIIKGILNQIKMDDYLKEGIVGVGNTENGEESLEDVEDLKDGERITVSLPCEVDELDCENFKNQKVAQDLFEACGGVGFDIHNLDPDKDGLACEDYDYENK